MRAIPYTLLSKKPHYPQVTGIAVRENCWKLHSVTDVELLQDLTAPADVLLLACLALQVLGSHVVPTVDVQNVTDYGVHPC